jgi:hypothetical protein
MIDDNITDLRERGDLRALLNFRRSAERKQRPMPEHLAKTVDRLKQAYDMVIDARRLVAAALQDLEKDVIPKLDKDKVYRAELHRDEVREAFVLLKCAEVKLHATLPLELLMSPAELARLEKLD